LQLAVYARFSTDRQDARSIDDQIRRCQRYAEQHGYTIVATYKDEAVSGSHLDRADLQRLLADARRTKVPPFSAIVVDDTSRLSRDMGNAWRLIFEDLAGVNVAVIDASTGRSSQDPDAWMSFGMSALLNHGFLQMVKHETHRGMEGRALKGFATGGRTYGFDSVKEPSPPDPEHPRKVYVVNETEAQVVRRVFRMFVEGTSLKSTAATLNAEGIRAPHDGGQGHKIGRGWGHTPVRAMLSNERYAGRVVWNRSKWIRLPGKRGRKQVGRPESEWIVKEEPALAIVDAATWEAVQLRFRRQPKGPHRVAGSGKHGRLLSGVARCGACQGSITVINTKRKAGIAYPNFGCTTHYSRGGSICSNGKLVSERKLTDGILGTLKQLVDKPQLVQRFLKKFSQHVQRLNDQKADVVDYGRHIREAENRIRNLTEALARVGFSEALGQQLKEEEARLAAARTAQASQLPNPGKLLIHPAPIRHYFENLVQVVQVDPARGRLVLLRHLQPVVLTPEQMEDGRWCYRVTTAFNLSFLLEDSPSPEVGTGLVEMVAGGQSAGYSSASRARLRCGSLLHSSVSTRVESAIADDSRSRPFSSAASPPHSGGWPRRRFNAKSRPSRDTRSSTSSPASS